LYCKKLRQNLDFLILEQALSLLLARKAAGKPSRRTAGKPAKLLAGKPRLRRASLKQDRVRSLAL
jgi:hypothetical protein